MGVERAAGLLADQKRRLILRLRLRLTAPSPLGIRYTGPVPCDLTLPASSLMGRAHYPGLPCMTLLLEEHECAPRIGGESRALTRPQWL